MILLILFEVYSGRILVREETCAVVVTKCYFSATCQTRIGKMCLQCKLIDLNKRNFIGFNNKN